MPRTIQVFVPAATIARKHTHMNDPSSHASQIQGTSEQVENKDNKSAARFLFALTIVLGAFLLFSVQLLIGKYILPWFGGAAGVWTTCLLFFQTILLAGYAYAHGNTDRLTLRLQTKAHTVLLLFSLIFLTA